MDYRDDNQVMRTFPKGISLKVKFVKPIIISRKTYLVRNRKIHKKKASLRVILTSCENICELGIQKVFNRVWVAPVKENANSISSISLKTGVMTS